MVHLRYEDPPAGRHGPAWENEGPGTSLLVYIVTLVATEIECFAQPCMSDW
jgi:hypothetical protein